ncbi:MAG: hypothetical protein ABWZ08_03580 [Pseudoxanthomonas sp.]
MSGPARHLLLFPLIAVLAACRPAATPEQATPDATPKEPKAPANASAAAASAAASMRTGPIPFSVEVTLSDKARVRLASPAETIIVSATYFADPLPTASARTNDVGQIDLGRAQAEIPAAGVAAFDGAGLLQDKLALVEGEPQVNINVHSGRKSAPDNLLDCGMFQDSLAVAAKAPIRIDCKLIAENL